MKKVVVASVLTGIFAIIVAYINGCFAKNDSTKEQHVISTISADSGNVSNINVQYKNNNSGDVNSDVIGRDKIINNYPVIKETDNKVNNSSKQKDTVIINNGILNQGGVNNTYNQVVNSGPEPRKLTDEELKGIIDSIPSKDYTIYIKSCPLEECIFFATQIYTRLKALGYQLVPSTGQIFIPHTKTERFKLAVVREQEFVNVIVFERKE